FIEAVDRSTRAEPNGRSFDQLITLSVGVTNATSNTLGSGVRNMFSVAWKRLQTNRFTINGNRLGWPVRDWRVITPYGASGQLLGVASQHFSYIRTIQPK